MNIGCLSIFTFPRVPWLHSPILQRSLSRVSESTLYCTSENEPSQFPIKIKNQSPSPALGSPVLWWLNSLYAMTHFKVSQTVRLQKDMVSTSLSHSIWSCMTVIFFHNLLSLPLPLLPIFLLTNKLVLHPAVRSWGRWAPDSSGTLWKPP